MDRKNFKEELKKYVEELKSRKLVDCVIDSEVDKITWRVAQYNDSSVILIVCLEELAELQKEITKCLRGNIDKQSRIGLLEEIADVKLAIKMLEWVNEGYSYIDNLAALEVKAKEIKRKEFNLSYNRGVKNEVR